MGKMTVKIISTVEFKHIRWMYEALGGIINTARLKSSTPVVVSPGVTLNVFRHDYPVQRPDNKPMDHGPFTFALQYEDEKHLVRFYQEDYRFYVHGYYDGQPYVDEFYDMGVLSELPNQ